MARATYKKKSQMMVKIVQKLPNLNSEKMSRWSIMKHRTWFRSTKRTRLSVVLLTTSTKTFTNTRLKKNENLKKNKNSKTTLRSLNFISLEISMMTTLQMSKSNSSKLKEEKPIPVLLRPLSRFHHSYSIWLQNQEIRSPRPSMEYPNKKS